MSIFSIPDGINENLLYSLCLGVGVAVCSIFYTNPKYLIYTYFRLQAIYSRMWRKSFTVSKDFTISYLERGSRGITGPSILLVHGFSSNKESFCDTIFFLPHRFHIISVDLFGHGDTSLKKDDEYSIATYLYYLKMFIDGIGLSRSKFHIVGNSLGAHVCGIYATLYPDTLLSITMLCPHGIHYLKEDIMRAEAEKTGKFVFLPQNDEEFRDLLKFLWHNDFYVPDIVVSGVQQIRTENNKFYEEALKALYEPHSIHLLEKNLHKLHTPLFVIWGKEDQCVSVECVETMKEKLPNPPEKIFILDEIGHAIQFEAPRRCAQILLECFDNS